MAKSFISLSPYSLQYHLSDSPIKKLSPPPELGLPLGLVVADRLDHMPTGSWDLRRSCVLILSVLLPLPLEPAGTSLLGCENAATRPSYPAEICEVDLQLT